jgi:hypothetical protein
MDAKLQRVYDAFDAYQDALADYLSAPALEPVFPGPLTAEERENIERYLTGLEEDDTVRS